MINIIYTWNVGFFQLVICILGFCVESEGSACNVDWEDPLEKGKAEFHGQKSLLGYSPWDHEESHTTERQHTHTHTHTIHLRQLRVFLWFGLALLFLYWIGFHFVNLSQFIHSLAERHLVCFQVLAIMNKVAISNHVQIYVRTEVFSSFGWIPRFTFVWLYGKFCEKPPSCHPQCLYKFAFLPLYPCTGYC